MSTHTPEPWPIWGDEPGMHRTVHICEGDSDSARECVNACAGINPEAVPKLMEVCRRAANIVSAHEIGQLRASAQLALALAEETT